MNMKLAKRLAVLAALLMLVLCLPVAGMAEQTGNVTWNGFKVESPGFYYYTEYEDYAPSLEVKKGATVTVTADYDYEGSENQSIYWNYYDGSEWIALESKTNTCTFTYAGEGRLTFTLNDNGPVIDKVIYVDDYEPKVEFDLELSHPVVDNVITVTEGETVTIDTNAFCIDPSVKVNCLWYWDTYDEQGEWVSSEQISSAISEYRFVATKSHDGMGISCYGFAGDSDMAWAWFDYTIKVVSTEFRTNALATIPDSAVTESIKANTGVKNADELEEKIEFDVQVEAVKNGMDADAVKVQSYEVTLEYSEDGGKTWKKATKDNWPASGTITVTLPYPAGTSQDTHNFTVAHMFAENMKDQVTGATRKAGDIEYLKPVFTAKGIQVQVSSLSPFAVAYAAKPAAPSVPTTGDSSTPYLWMLGMLIAAAGCVTLVSKRRQNG